TKGRSSTVMAIVRAGAASELATVHAHASVASAATSIPALIARPPAAEGSTFDLARSAGSRLPARRRAGAVAGGYRHGGADPRRQRPLAGGRRRTGHPAPLGAP